MGVAVYCISSLNSLSDKSTILRGGRGLGLTDAAWSDVGVALVDVGVTDIGS